MQSVGTGCGDRVCHRSTWRTPDVVRAGPATRSSLCIGRRGRTLNACARSIVTVAPQPRLTVSAVPRVSTPGPAQGYAAQTAKKRPCHRIVKDLPPDCLAGVVPGCSRRPGSISRTSMARACRPSATAQRPELAGRSFQAMGVSLVIHPRNPTCRPRTPTCASSSPKAGRRAGLVVRRRLRPDALLRLRARTPALAPDGARRLRAVRRRGLPALQAVVRRVLLPQAPQRAARHRRAVLRRPQRLGLRALFAFLRSVGDHYLPAYLPIVERRRDTPLRRARARFPALPPRALRGVQPGLRPRHPVRPAVGRPHRVDPDVAAAAGALASTTGSPSRAAPRLYELYEVSAGAPCRLKPESRPVTPAPRPSRPASRSARRPCASRTRR
jgi:hypothetical protein